MNQDWVNDWYSLGVTAEVAPGAVIHKTIGKIGLALLNVKGSFFALEDTCGGCGQALSKGRLKNGEIECAGCGLHVHVGRSFESTAPASFPVMVVDNEIFAWIANAEESSRS